MTAIQLGDLYGVSHGIGPEEKAGYVVNCNTFRTLQLCSDNWDDVSSTKAGLADCWSGDIGPVHHLVQTVVGHSNHYSVRDVEQRFGLLLLNDVSIKWHVFNLPTLREQQMRSRSDGMDVKPWGRTQGSGSNCLIDTQRRATVRSCAGVRDLVPVGVHTPALLNALVALCGFVGSVLITLGNVLTDSWTRTE